MGDRIVVMSEGKVQQIGPPEDLYNRPANTFVATFLGSPGMCLVQGSCTAGDVSVAGVTVARAAIPDGPVTVGVRPETLSIATDGVPATAHFVEVLGADTLVLCELEHGERILVRQELRAPRPGADAPVHIAFGRQPGDVHLFDSVTGLRLEAS